MIDFRREDPGPDIPVHHTGQSNVFQTIADINRDPRYLEGVIRFLRDALPGIQNGSEDVREQLHKRLSDLEALHARNDTMRGAARLASADLSKNPEFIDVLASITTQAKDVRDGVLLTLAQTERLLQQPDADRAAVIEKAALNLSRLSRTAGRDGEGPDFSAAVTLLEQYVPDVTDAESAWQEPNEAAA